jgi:hypothetical protein
MLMLLAVSAFGATVRLYLKDGTYQLVREYQVLSDRVKYLSAERGEWEELPLELVDLDHTKKELAASAAAAKEEAKVEEEEDAAVRAERLEVASVPQTAGGYYIHNGKLEPIKQAEVTIVNDKKRTVLKYLSPIPVVPGKSTAEIPAATAPLRITEVRPEFYFRLNESEGLAIVKLSSKKNLRVVEEISILAITQETTETRHEVATFKRQFSDLLFKIWPEKPLEPGEYALLEYSDGKVNPQVWDFSVGAAR